MNCVVLCEYLGMVVGKIWGTNDLLLVVWTETVDVY
jgi:hypothetical protein